MTTTTLIETLTARLTAWELYLTETGYPEVYRARMARVSRLIERLERRAARRAGWL